MKNIKNGTAFKSSSLKTKVVIATAIMGIALVSVGGINNANYKSSTSTIGKNVKVFGAVYTIQYGVTNASTLSVRSGAGTNYPILGSMKRGTKITITDKINNFYKTTYNGKTGYISAQYVKITAKPVVVVVKPTTPTIVYKTQYGVTTAGVSIRTGASTAYSIQGSFANATSINILGTAGSFYKVSYGGKTGYVSNQYVKITAKPVVVVVKPTTPTIVYKTQYGVTTAGVSIRTGASTAYSIQGSFANATNINILGTAGSFYKVSYGGKTGYVSNQYVKITVKPVVVVKPTTPTIVYKTQYGVTTAGVSIRTGASTAYSIQGSFANATNINILGTAGSFYKVSYGGKTGYVSNQYVKITAKPVAVVVKPTTPTIVYKTQYGITTAGVNIRTGGSTAYSIQGTFANATNINILGTIGSFYKVSYGGKTGYVSNQYVKITAKPVGSKAID